jgi:high-affinity iron transporter
MRFHPYTILLFLLIPLVSVANKSEESRILVHTLNYLGHDYVHAVKNGKIVDAEEYHEMLEFCESAEKYFAELSTTWSKEDSARVSGYVMKVISLVEKKADFQEVANATNEAKTQIISVTGLKTFPAKYPDINNGKILFAAECAKCHGKEGYGDGSEGLELSPKPRNFHDEERMRTISGSHIFNTIRLGVQGTGMKAHPTLEDAEVWDLAFYVLTLRYKLPEASKASAGLFNNISLEKISVLSDEDLKREFGLKDDQLAEIRFNKPKQSNDKFLQTAESYLLKSEKAYIVNDAASAMKYASLAYLEGIEPIEIHLKASDPELSERLEDQFKRIRKMISENRPTAELKDSMSAARVTLVEISSLLEKNEYSFWMAFLMSISILLREGVEAFLVILVVLSILKASNLASSSKWVHIGWIAALISGISLWFATNQLLPVGVSEMEILEGVISLIAVVMLLYVGFWLHGKSEAGKWKEYVSGLVKNATQNGSNFGLASLSFFVVFREVFESVLFLSALNIESAGTQENAIVLGFFGAVILLVVLAIVLLRFSTKLPIPKLFQISSFIMGALAVVLTGKGVHSFQETSLLPIHSLPIARIDFLGVYPTFESCAAQLLVLLLVVAILRRSAAKS